MVGDAAAAERGLALGYAPANARAGLTTLFALDDRLGEAARRGREPMVTLMRLTWWAEALERLDAGAPPAEPLLRALAAEVLPAGVRGATLAGMVDGWELLLEPEPLDEIALARFGVARGGALFAAAGELLGAADPRLATMGEGWALADLATRLPDAAVARSMAEARLASVFGRPWPRALRPLGALALLARSHLAGGAPGSPGRVGRLLLHRLTGR